MTSQLLQSSSVVQSQLNKNLPDFTTGCVIEVHYKIKEGDKQRVQVFKGLVVNLHEKKSLDARFTVLKVSTGGIKVERTFPLHSPFISKVVVVETKRARRANIRNWAILQKNPAKSVRTKAFRPDSQ